MKDLTTIMTTFYPATRVTVQVYQKVIAFLDFLFVVVAAFDRLSFLVFGLKVMPNDRVPIDDEVLWTQITQFVEMSGRTDEDVCDVVHVGGKQIHLTNINLT